MSMENMLDCYIKKNKKVNAIEVTPSSMLRRNLVGSPQIDSLWINKIGSTDYDDNGTVKRNKLLLERILLER